MTFLSSLISSIAAYLPQIIIGLVIVAIIVMILVVVFTSVTVKNAIKSRVPPKPKEDKKEPTRPAEDKMPPLGGRLSEILSMRGFFEVGDLSLVFLRVLELLRQRLDTVNYKYHLPWYLLIGPSGSGKTTMMDCSEITLPLGKPDFGVEEHNPGVRWWFLNRGIVLDVRGDFLIGKRGIQGDEKGWRTVVSLLNRYRARRPIDGIILTIPATELYGRDKLSLEEISDRAKFLARKLITTQNMMGLRLPVYIVISKSDCLPGYQSFCQSIPLANRHNMLGWTSPYHPGTGYTSEWVDEAFGHLHNQLNHVRLEILASGAAPEARDGVFVFPGELMHIVAPLRSYLNNIFKVNSYDESLVLRGIYLCGDSGINLELSQLTSKPMGLNESNEINHQSAQDVEEEEKVIQLPIGGIEEIPAISREVERHVFFFQDVLFEKVCKETGLAQPIHHRLIKANRNLNLAKASMVGFVGVTTFGLLNGYDRFSENRDYMLPVLGKINTILYQVPTARLNESHATASMFDEQTRQLLDMMNNIQRSSFFSIFYPSSWFSPINTNLRTALKVSYDHIILRTIYMDLLLKARDLLTLRPLPTDVTVSLAAQLQPIATIEYQLMKGFVDRYIELNRYIEKYNRLKESSDADLLKELVAYTLGIELPDEFIKNYSRFRRVLNEVPYPNIDLKPYQPAAQETLQILYNHFLNNLLGINNPNSIIGKINYILKEFGQRQTEELPDLEPLRKISKDLNQTLTTIGAPGSNWIDGQYFDPGAGFSDLMGEISEFPGFGPQLLNQFAAQTAILFGNFQNDLRQLNTILVEKSKLPTDKPQHPSDGLIELQKSLASLFNQDFMTVPGPERVITNIADNQSVYWNSKLIDMASDEVRKYEEYVEKSISEFPPLIRETIKQAAKRNLQRNVISLIAKAQTLAPAPQEQVGTVAAEENLRNRIADVREIAPKFIKLLQVMNDSGIGTDFVSIRTMLGTLATRLLNQVDKVFDSYQLYKVKEDNFDWWDGKGSPIYIGLNLRDDQEMQSYLTQQRGIVKQLALEYAHTMVDFLSAPIMKEFQGNTLLLNKWRHIVDQVSAYELKKPDNTLIVLENTLSKDLADLDVKKCFKAIPLNEIKKGSGDYFANRRVELRRGILARCEVLRRTESLDNYQKLSAFFNENLKDKFPFAIKPGPKTTESDPTDILDFYKMYKEFGDNPKEILDQVYQLGDEASDLYAFLTGMEKVKEFFDGYLKANPLTDVPTFDFSVDFRVNQSRETSGNMIIDWSVMPNENTEVTNHDKNRVSRWSYGDPFTLSLKWPEVSQIQPYRDPNQPYLDVSDGVASFTYPGRWSLLWMLKLQQAPSGDFSTMKEPTPYVLKFNIPNGPSKRTIVYNRITLLAPGKGNKPGKPIRMPDFPARAPEIGKSLMDKANDPVLVKGVVEDFEPQDEPKPEPIPAPKEAQGDEEKAPPKKPDEEAEQ